MYCVGKTIGLDFRPFCEPAFLTPPTRRKMILVPPKQLEIEPCALPLEEFPRSVKNGRQNVVKVWELWTVEFLTLLYCFTSIPGRNVTKNSHSPLLSKQLPSLTSDQIRGFRETVWITRSPPNVLSVVQMRFPFISHSFHSSMQYREYTILLYWFRSWELSSISIGCTT